MDRNGTLSYFKESCEQGTLQFSDVEAVSWPDASHPVRYSHASGWVNPVENFPLADFNYFDPEFWESGIVLDYDDGRVGVRRSAYDVSPRALGFGVYCIFVSPTLDVRLECDKTTHFYVGCEGRSKSIVLQPGFSWLLVHDDLGLSAGHYTVEGRCHDRTDTCGPGGLVAISMNPSEKIGAVTPPSLLALLADPGVTLVRQLLQACR